ncbi:hypothetical protein CgunFtcFv8_015270 [Champsocephalus gunnari]|uniref:Uncharacterized protein n=1 Tax=Champsocephalus gunnari TaxID=52237 RepID=A0AAN8C8Y7_CHAGU|nr:hypothetical protein CgunFtcFv8_015270 [Champsocephalus gunnari]
MCWKAGFTCRFTIPAKSILFFVVSVPFCLCRSHQPLRHDFKRPDRATRMTRKEGRPSTEACLWPVYEILFLVGRCFRLAACLRRRNAALEVFPSDWLRRAFPRVFVLPGGDPNTLSYRHVELGAHGKGERVGRW